MSKNLYVSLKGDYSFVESISDFFTSELTNFEKFTKIKQICIEESKRKFPKFNPKDIESGYLSQLDFVNYLHKTNQSDEFNEVLTGYVIDGLLNSGLLIESSEIFEQFTFKSYKVTDYGKYLYDRKLILNLILGSAFIINRYSNSLVKIEHEAKNGEKSIGTGFYIAFMEESIITSISVPSAFSYFTRH